MSEERSREGGMQEAGAPLATREGAYAPLTDNSIAVIVNFCEADAQYLPRCIANVQWQLAGRDQLIVVCDTDRKEPYREHETALAEFNKATELTAATGGQFVVSGGGISKSRNAGAAKATGKWLKFMDVDDVLAPFALDAVRKKKMPPEAKLVRGGMTTIRNGLFILDWIPASDTAFLEQERIMLFAPWSNILKVNPALVSHTFIEREAFNAVGGFEEKLDWEEDWDLWLRIWRKYGNESLAAVRDRICYYWVDEAERAKKKRRHEVTVCVDGKEVEIDAHEYLRRQYGCEPAK